MLYVERNNQNKSSHWIYKKRGSLKHSAFKDTWSMLWVCDKIAHLHLKDCISGKIWEEADSSWLKASIPRNIVDY